MFRRIVVGCDGSERQAGALALAEQLRDRDGGRLILANVFPLVRRLARPALAIEYATWLGQRADETLEAAAASLDPAVPVQLEKIAAPSSSAGLNDLAERVDADLIVLGRSERGAVTGMAARKTVQRLLHGAPCAVAGAAPGRVAAFGAAPRIVVGYDASPEAETAVTAAYDIAAATSASVVLCEVLEPVVVALAAVGYLDVGEAGTVERAASAELELATERAPEGVTAEPLVVRGSPVYSELIEVAEGADLLVSGSRGFGPLHRAIAGSTSVELLKGAPMAVLVTPRAGARRASEPDAL